MGVMSARRLDHRGVRVWRVPLPAQREPRVGNELEEQHEPERNLESAARVEAGGDARPVDDETDAPLRREPAAEHHEVERGVGARRELGREPFVQRAEGEDVRGSPEPVQEPPDVSAGKHPGDRRKRDDVERKPEGEEMARPTP
jgi:hypothetical protein